MRKILMVLAAIILSVGSSAFGTKISKFSLEARAEENETLIEEISEPVLKQLETIDLGELEDYFDELNLSDIFNSKTLKDLVYALITGEEELNLDTITGVITAAIKTNISTVLSLVVTIVLIVAASKISQILTTSGTTQGIVNYIVVILILGLISGLISESIIETLDSITKIKSVMEVLSPILLSLLSLIGASGASSAYQPTLVILIGGVLELAAYVLTAVVTLYFVLSIIGCLTDHIKLNKFKGFLVSFFKFSIGIVFTIFVGYLSLTGINSATRDGISIKTAKYALRSYLPLVGGYVSDSYEVFRAGSVLIKNSIGTVGVVILFSVVIVKILNLSLYNLGFKLAGALIEPLGENKISEFLSSLSVVFNFLIATIVAVFMMCFISLLIIISTANVA